jgi:hypothetical protein
MCQVGMGAHEFGHAPDVKTVLMANSPSKLLFAASEKTDQRISNQAIVTTLQSRLESRHLLHSAITT